MIEQHSPDFTVWLVTRKFRHPALPNLYHIQPLSGGRLPNLAGFVPMAIYATAEDAAAAVERGDDIYNVFDIPRPRPIAGTPIAWLVTFIILMHETGESTLAVEPTCGEQLIWDDDRTVMGVFPTKQAAQTWVASGDWSASV